MHIQRVYLENFGPHDSLDVNLPKHGLFLITGQNGSGKSTLVEAVSWAIWGKTLRGASMYRKKQHCLVRVYLDYGVIERSRSKSGKGAVSFTDKAGKCTEFDTAADAQTALVQMVGAADIWRRTHIFSSNDPILFSSASDGDKKRLLETLLGLEKFDEALASCRKELVEANKEYGMAEMRLQGIETDVLRLTQNVASHKESLDALTHGEAEKFVHTTQEAIDTNQAECQKEDKACRVEIQRLEQEKDDTKEKFMRLVQVAKTKKEAVNSIQGGECYTCGSSVPEANLRTLEKGAKEAALAVSAEKQQVNQELAGIDANLAKYHADLAQIAGTVGELHNARSQLKLKKSRGIMEDSLKRALKELSLQDKRAVKSEKDAAEKRKNVEILKYTEAVLGLKGVRAHVLSNALGGIESATNVWLGRISDKPMKIRLSASDKGVMALDVEGVGGGNGYKGSSGGERRRIDIALLLALADVAAGATHADPGTLFLDEVLDAIDDEGVGLLSSALREVASRRPIILITHSETLAHAVSQFASGHLNLRTGNGQS